ncbi:MAG: cell division protein ZipA [Porticoccaceae bacterium]|nr:cell division protein ZipA [Porticoccaceae bacterium]
MDFGAREILIIVAFLALIGVVLDGMRRIKRNRYEKLHMSSRKMNKTANREYFDDNELDQSQFPSGGSRVVGSREVNDSAHARVSAKTNESSFLKQPEQQGFDLDHSIYASRDDEFSDLDSLSVVQNSSSEIDSKSKTNGANEVSQDVLVMHLMASKGNVIQGSDLLDASIAAGLRYGGMKIFHRHLNEDGSGSVLFSMANVVNPGTFDLNTIATITSPGVTLFMSLDEVEDSLSAFDLLIDSARLIAEKLHLNMMDESRSSMTAQTIDHYRQRAKKAMVQSANGQ